MADVQKGVFYERDKTKKFGKRVEGGGETEKQSGSCMSAAKGIYAVTPSIACL